MRIGKSSFWRLMRFARPYMLQVRLSILSNILMALFTVMSAPLIGRFIQILFSPEVPKTEQPTWQWTVSGIEQWITWQLNHFILTQGREKALLYVCLVLLAVFFAKNIFRYLALFFMAPVRNGIVRDLREKLFSKLLALPLSYYNQERKGDLMTRISTDVQEVEWSILNVLEAAFREPVMITCSLGLLLYISPQLTVVVFLLILFTGLVIGGIGKSLRRNSAQVQQRMANMTIVVEEALSGLRIIKGFNAESYQREKYMHEANAYRHAFTRLLWRKDLASPMSEFLGIAVVSVLLWYGSRIVFNGQMEAQSFVTFLMAFYYIIDPAKSLTRAMYDIQKGIAALQRIEQVLDAPLVIEDAPALKQTPPDKLKGVTTRNPKPLTFHRNIRYEQVGFQYPNTEEAVLKDIHIEISKGQVVALVGASGAGKSTIADLLPRFYDVSSGSIRIDDVDIRDITQHDLRNLMGIVSQEAVLFNDTIYNNIVFGLQGVGEEQVIAAAKMAYAHDFIMATEHGYQTGIGDRGMKLSGGQRQRLTLARAFLKDPAILILDEATSALDSESEKWVQQALMQLMEGRTALVIAHRLSTIQHADQILVMQQGRIIERGTHQTLLQLNGEYKKLVSMQLLA